MSEARREHTFEEQSGMSLLSLASAWPEFYGTWTFITTWRMIATRLSGFLLTSSIFPFADQGCGGFWPQGDQGLA